MIGPDAEPELHNHDLAAWVDNYLTNMLEVLRNKTQARASSLAKKNADFWVLQNGVGGLGTTFGQETLPEPLRMFTGDALLEALTGVRLTTVGEKRTREEDGEDVENDVDDEGRRVRSRSAEKVMGQGDNDIMMNDTGHMDSDPVEDVSDKRHAIRATLTVDRPSRLDEKYKHHLPNTRRL